MIYPIHQQIDVVVTLKHRRLNVFVNICLTSKHCYADVSDSDSYRARHPVTTYEDYRGLIGRIAAGQEKLLIAEKPLILAMTSGTSGPSSMLLSTKDTNNEFFLQVKFDEDVLLCK